jgi:hypothetical protein
LIRDFPNIKYTLNGGVVSTHQVSLFSFCYKHSTLCSALLKRHHLHISVDVMVFVFVVDSLHMYPLRPG